jgi:hypothetical protein
MILLFAFIAVTMAWIDSEHLNKNEYILNHLSRSVLRALICLTIGFYSINGAILFALVFWLLFDQVLNFFRGKDIFYLGTVAKLDIFFSKNIALYILLKGLVLFVIIFVTIKNINLWEKILSVF